MLVNQAVIRLCGASVDHCRRNPLESITVRRLDRKVSQGQRLSGAEGCIQLRHEVIIAQRRMSASYKVRLTKKQDDKVNLLSNSIHTISAD